METTRTLLMKSDDYISLVHGRLEWVVHGELHHLTLSYISHLASMHMSKGNCASSKSSYNPPGAGGKHGGAVAHEEKAKIPLLYEHHEYPCHSVPFQGCFFRCKSSSQARTGGGEGNAREGAPRLLGPQKQ